MASSPYTDLTRPPLAVRALQRALIVPGGLWQRLDVVAETGSTNADVSQAAQGGAGEGLVVIAEQQVSGRGRRDRQWVSPPRAGLTLSVLLRPGLADPDRGWVPAPHRTWGWLPLLAGVALREAVERIGEIDATLKWPNDLLLPDENPTGRATGRAAEEGEGRTAEQGEGRAAEEGEGRAAEEREGRAAEEGDGRAGEPAGNAGQEPPRGKTAGILAEVAGDAVVVGIGLNVSTRADELPETNGLPATSLLVSGAKSTDRDPLLRALLRGFAQWYAGWREAGGDAEMCGLLAAYRRGCSTIGREVRVLLPDGGVITGVASTVDGDGQLVVRTVDGSERRVSAGDVLHVR
ncbi:biotin--[acetyl-CoA-carboxylase] ligase [Actinoplanes sp. N902-109]|uniref:biotin--[acetyl-CoA-carboxylase] ligase n=1 Tax=Actinoplanes sp. (strain N902-109) TaxID=649831 RepID=UPI0003295679|nr:biotin--[acetyl-CoA-carboxylase] ligase [Actinoplanes sp. N902-109]AGL20984.1 biotin-acetyl-CoA-carboxylase ligase [Actinoplanes sp. N902-109]